MNREFDNEDEYPSDEENWMDTGWTDGSHMTRSGSEAVPTTEIRSSSLLTMPDNTKANDTVVNRMLLNDNKAGMEGIDKERINQIIYEASKGSKYFENERRKEKQMNTRIEEQKQKMISITDTQLEDGVTMADALLEELDFTRDLSRTIVHIDMDAFYANVEIQDNPSLRDKPMAVGDTYMLSTSNYHARKFGVRAAMPGFIGKKLCPELVIVPTNFDKYTKVSKEVRVILEEYDPNYCPVSLDEAYIDLTDHLQRRDQMSEEERTLLCRRCDPCDKTFCLCDLNSHLREIILKHKNDEESDSVQADDTSGFRTSETSSDIEEKHNKENASVSSRGIDKHSKSLICPDCKKRFPDYDVVTYGITMDDAVLEMRNKIEQRTCLTASAGIAPNRMLAKVASDKNKPNGQYKILATRDDVMSFIRDLSIRKISGIGKVSECMLNALGVKTCTDLYNQRGLLYHLYSRISFNYFMRICLGIGSTTVDRDGERKSMSTERTFSEISKPAELYNKCYELCQALSEDLKEEKLKGKTVSIKVKTVNFEVKTRASTLPNYISDEETMFSVAKELLKTEIQNVAPEPLRLRLMGVRISSLCHQNACKGKQNTLELFVRKMASKNKNVNNDSYKMYDIGEETPCVVDGDPSPMSTVDKENHMMQPGDELSSRLCTAEKEAEEAPRSCVLDHGEGTNSRMCTVDSEVKQTTRPWIMVDGNDKQSSGLCTLGNKNGQTLLTTESEVSDVNVVGEHVINKEAQLHTGTEDGKQVTDSSRSCRIHKDAKSIGVYDNNPEVDNICTEGTQIRSSIQEPSNANTVPSATKSPNVTLGSQLKDSRETIRSEDSACDTRSTSVQRSSDDSEMKSCVESFCNNNAVQGTIHSVCKGDDSVVTKEDSVTNENNQELSDSARKADTEHATVHVNAVIHVNGKNHPAVNGQCDTLAQPEAGESSDDHHEVIGQSFYCPVCNGNIGCDSLFKFNQHIDTCLNKSAVKECIQGINEDGIQNNKIEKIKSFTNFDKSLQKSPKSAGVKRKSTITAGKISSNVITKQSKPPPVQKEEMNDQEENDSRDTHVPKHLNPCQQKSVRPTENFICPVCFMEQSGVTLEAFNSHVDTCLCSGTISKMIKEQNSLSRNTVKRNGMKIELNGKMPSAKRKRRESDFSTKTKCINSFFKLS